MGFSVSGKTKCKLCNKGTYPGNKVHDRPCANCGKHFCGPECKRTCSKECALQRQSRGGQNWGGKICEHCNGGVSTKSKRHGKKCLSCKIVFCGRADTCSLKCSKALMSRRNAAHWDKKTYRIKQAKARAAQAGRESREARALRAAFGLKDREIPKFGYRWDSWWKSRKIFWEHMGCHVHFCKECKLDFQDIEAALKKRKADRKKRLAAKANGWRVFYTWSHDLARILHNPDRWVYDRLGFHVREIELPKESERPFRKCSQCNREARPKCSTCSQKCAKLAMKLGGAIARKPDSQDCMLCGHWFTKAGKRYHNLECQNQKCAKRFCVPNQSHVPSFCSHACAMMERKAA